MTIFQALSGQTRHAVLMASWNEVLDPLVNERWLRSCCGADEPAMLVNSGVLKVIRESMVQDSW